VDQDKNYFFKINPISTTSIVDPDQMDPITKWPPGSGMVILLNESGSLLFIKYSKEFPEKNSIFNIKKVMVQYLGYLTKCFFFNGHRHVPVGS
jgi:hypothetical protein